jgi:hypothetical protein
LFAVVSLTSVHAVLDARNISDGNNFPTTNTWSAEFADSLPSISAVLANLLRTFFDVAAGPIVLLVKTEGQEPEGGTNENEECSDQNPTCERVELKAES